jgi:mRNA-degrading endonuclease RelE of RelBE toxin-antitoxin system
MKVKFEDNFIWSLNNQVLYIALDKPKAARKFKSDLIRNLRKDLKQPFNYQKSKYYQDENIRDYVFKGYTSVYVIDQENNIVTVFGFIKHKESL